MPHYTPPIDDIRFVLHDVLSIEQSTAVDGYPDLTPDMTAGILEEAGKLAVEILLPLNPIGDREGCVLEAGSVRTPAGFRAAMDVLREGGWPSLECDPDYGGQGMPNVLNMAIGEMHSACNMALMMYPGLTHGAYSAIHTHGSEAQRQLYLPKLVSGEWTGTMNLTEPHCGTDLGLLRTKAEPREDGSCAITGQKIFISSGEHDLAENIIHLVLARLPDAPEGVKGISLFIVPKILVQEDGSFGERNALSCGALERKMGIHGNATCVMNYDGATGFLLGEPHKGLRAMFTMMNEARLAVGMQGLAQASIAYQNAAAYAKERLQGRAVGGAAEPDKPADPILVHPDIRRLLMEQKAFVEGGRALLYWASTLNDIAHRHTEPAAREAADDLVGLLTPVIKAFLTDEGFAASVKAQQVFGGHGYIEEWGQSQFVRDARIAMIYEGANGVQALDLVGRKLAQKGGKPLVGLLSEIKDFCKRSQHEEAFRADFIDPLKDASKALQEAAMFFAQHGMKNPDIALAGSTDFLHLFGHVGMAYMWARMAKTAGQIREADPDREAFCAAKIATGRFYMQKVLPISFVHLARLKAGAGSVMALGPEDF
ncbi:MAG: acyl-CoA dehydrogenase C-terminal domain-containing protein [Neomegalonema sp.]|nr:acyl-CoA dehydrogenase C-terminal domain-containing protein [Neomegalonema sp.]